MKKNNKQLTALSAAIVLSVGLMSSAQAHNHGNSSAELTTSELIKQAIESDRRPASEKARDRNRRPAETLAFLGLEKDMKVLELMPGRAWYSNILSAVLKDSGKLYSAVSTRLVKKYHPELLSSNQLTLIDVPTGRRTVKLTTTFDVEPFSLDVEPLDMVVTFRNYHNLTQASRRNINKAVFEALKPGGVYAVIDHNRRHMQSDNGENRRRLDPVMVIKDVQQSGFVLADYSDVNARPDDELRYEVGRKSISGNSDRFTLKFVKPK